MKEDSTGDPDRDIDDRPLGGGRLADRLRNLAAVKDRQHQSEGEDPEQTAHSRGELQDRK